MATLGIDHEFVNLIYFPSETAKAEYLKAIQTELQSDCFNNAVNPAELLKCFTSNEWSQNPIPLLRYAIQNLFVNENGIQKLGDVNAAANLISHNLEAKRESSNCNFDNEYKLLIDHIISKDDSRYTACCLVITGLLSAATKCKDIHLVNQLADVSLRHYSNQEKLSEQIKLQLTQFIKTFISFKDRDKAKRWLDFCKQLNPDLDFTREEKKINAIQVI